MNKRQQELNRKLISFKTLCKKKRQKINLLNLFHAMAHINKGEIFRILFKAPPYLPEK